METKQSRWRKERLGEVTASRFKDVITQPRSRADKEAGKLSGTALAYAYELLAERATGLPADRVSTIATKWGLEWEHAAWDRAVEALTWRLGVDEDQVDIRAGDYTYVAHPDEPHIGCSPDGFVGEHALVEIKCPYNSSNHARAIYDSHWFLREHEAQWQGSLWVTGRSQYFLASFDPRWAGRELVLITARRDEDKIKEIERAVIAFRDRVDWIEKNESVGV